MLLLLREMLLIVEPNEEEKEKFSFYSFKIDILGLRDET